MKNLAAKDWVQTDIIWFLELEYDGTTFRFSSITMNLSDTSGKSYPYIGGLEDVSILQRMGSVGKISTQEDSVSIAITFPNRNIAKEIYNGMILDGNTVQVGFVLIRGGQIVQSFEERQILYKGLITEPVYGYPESPAGYVEFSIENKAIYTEEPLLRTILGENLYIEDVSMTPNANIGQTPPFPVSDNIVNVADIHRGKVIPWVFGELGGILRENNTETNIPISPAYVVAYDSTGPKPCYYVIAGHATNATQVKLYNNLGEETTEAVSTFINVDNRTFSYVDIDGTSHSWTNSVAANNDRQVWVEWTNGAPYLNPFEDGDLKGGGDICLMLLQEITDSVDVQAWLALRPILNQYEFGGYVNDDEITIFEWLQKNIIPYLPISIVNGPKGLKPILDLFLDGADLAPRTKVTTGAEFFRAGPIVPLNSSEDIINVINIRYAVNGVTNTPTARMMVSNFIPPTPALGFALSPISKISRARHGIKRRAIKLDYCYDWKTANKIAQNIIVTNGLIVQSIQYSVALHYGYLEIGDIIEITDNDLGFRNLKAQLISKQYQDNRWIMEFKLDNNPNRIVKTDV